MGLLDMIEGPGWRDGDLPSRSFHVKPVQRRLPAPSLARQPGAQGVPGQPRRLDTAALGAEFRQQISAVEQEGLKSLTEGMPRYAAMDVKLPGFQRILAPMQEQHLDIGIPGHVVALDVAIVQNSLKADPPWADDCMKMSLEICQRGERHASVAWKSYQDYFRSMTLDKLLVPWNPEAPSQDLTISVPSATVHSGGWYGVKIVGAWLLEPGSMCVDVAGTVEALVGTKSIKVAHSRPGQDPPAWAEPWD